MHRLLPMNIQPCLVKVAIDLAVRSQPPLINAPQPDDMNLSVDQIGIIVINYIDM
jgi:hypothetical protein